MKSAFSSLSNQLSAELASLALEMNIISPEQFNDAQKHSNETHQDIYKIIQADGLINESELIKKLGERYGISSHEEFNVKTVDNKFPRKYCSQNFLLPIENKNDKLLIALAAPSSLNSLKNLSVLVGSKAEAIFVPFSKLKSKLINFEKFENIDDGVKIIDASKKTVKSQTTIVDHHSNPKMGLENTETIAVDNLKKFDKSSKSVKALTGDVISGVSEIFDSAIVQKISDIHIEQHKNEARIRFRRNGALFSPEEFQSFVSKNFLAIVSRIKILSGLDIAERRLPQDGGANYISQKNNTDVDLRISIVPTSFGERVVIRILNKSSLSLDINSLGFSDNQQVIFQRSIEAPQGLVLVTGPTGSGKSTTLYGAINHLNNNDVNILTAEDPVEYSISGIGQVQVREEIGLTFASALRSFLRQDPEIILVGEIRDAETADIATKAALTGHLVLSTLHTNSAVGAITRLINMGLPRYLVSNALTCVVAQRLVRISCNDCIRPYRPNELEEISKNPLFDINQRHLLKKSDGCQKCLGTGFVSRKAVHEVLNISFGIKALINMDASEQDIVELAKKEGYVPMIERSRDFVYQGLTTIDEILRVVPIESS
jgi:type IV pilus assembly protein PilB